MLRLECPGVNKRRSSLASLTPTQTLQGNPAVSPGISGDNMRKDYYNPMRNQVLAHFSACTITIITAASLLSPPRATTAPQQDSLKAASLESHEGLTVSALPWTTASQYKEKFPKKSPFDGGVLAVQVNFRNDSDESLRVNLQAIRLQVQLDEDHRQEVPSLTPEQLADAALKPKTKDPTASRGPRLPVPLPTKKGGRDKHWEEMEKDADSAQIPTSVIAPHSTVQGLLYFDLGSQFDLLQTAHLYIPQISKMNHSGTLTYFDIDLSRHQ